MAIDGATDIPREVIESVLEYEQTFRDKVNPEGGVCLFASAVLPGADVDAPLHRDDFLTMIAGAAEAGHVPIGPIAYASDDPNVVFSEDGHSVTISTVENGIPALMVRAGLGAGGSLVVAGTRYGRLSNGESSPVHALLSDVEGFLAEVFVYTHYRARQIGHTGAARIYLRAERGATDELMVLRHIDEESGRLTAGIHRDMPDFTFDFDISAPHVDQHERLYGFCSQVAATFGAAAAQLISPPQGSGDDAHRRSDAPSEAPIGS